MLQFLLLCAAVKMQKGTEQDSVGKVRGWVSRGVDWSLHYTREGQVSHRRRLCKSHHHCSISWCSHVCDGRQRGLVRSQDDYHQVCHCFRLHLNYTSCKGCTIRGPDPAPEHVISGSRSRLINARNFSWMTEILFIHSFILETYIAPLQ